MSKITKVIMGDKEFPVVENDDILCEKTIFNEPMKQVIVTMHDNIKIEIWVNKSNMDRLTEYLKQA